jgi:sugar phosphate isomerase/epimerase
MGIGGRSDEWEQVKGAIVDCLGEMGEAADREGFVIAGEAHCGAAVDRSDRALWAIEAVGNERVRLHFDIVHMYLSGEPIV